MRPLVGYNYGAREHGRVARLYNLTLGLSAAIMAIGTVLCLTISGSLIGLFSSNPETIAIGTTALRIICLGFVVSAVSTTCIAWLFPFVYSSSFGLSSSLRRFSATCIQTCRSTKQRTPVMTPGMSAISQWP